MFTVAIAISLGLIGAIMGSFAGATTWRLRAFQLKADKAAGEKVDKAEYKRLLPLTKATFTTDRSHCLSCGYALRWYDLIPIVSWLSLGGRCRQCRQPIGWFEFLIEIGMTAFFVLSYLLWPGGLGTWQAVAHLALWLCAGVGLAILFSYDIKWFLLPDVVNWTVVGIGVAIAILSVATAAQPWNQLVNVLASVAVLGGLYLVIYLASRGGWVGFGDVKLGLGLGLLLADWQLSFFTLFAANLIGCLVVLPGLLTKKLTAKSHVPFGPFLIGGAVLGQWFGAAIIAFYMSHLVLFGA